MILMLGATRDLWRFGHGLPASPFPPQRLVTRGAYRLVANPIYIGAVCVSAGASLWAHSAAGIWIVTPTLALAAAAFVLGYERDATYERFGATNTPWLRLPPASDEPPTVADRVSVYALVLAPWLVLYEAVQFLRASTGSIDAAAFLFVLAAPLVARRRRDIREFGRSGIAATAIVIPFSLLVPFVASTKPVVIWVLLAVRMYSSSFPRLRWVWWSAVVAMSAAALSAGMTTLADIGAGVIAYVIVMHRSAVWRLLQSATERVANSWHEWRIGPARLINHGVYAGLGAAFSIALSLSLAGAAQFGWLAASVAGVVVGAAVWGQLIEGSSVLLRPYGYFGGVAGAIIVALVAALSGADAWLILCAFGVGSTMASAFGRVRCLVQGCCHGRAAPDTIGIRFTHPRSRVLRLSALGGVPVHPTQLYALVSALFTGCVLVRLWVLAAPLSFIAGVYFLLTGVSRFVEEHFRGEPQTVIVAGLRLYQWLAIGFVIGGAVLTTIRSAPAPAPQPIELGALPVLALIAVLTCAAYGMDFPASHWRYSRLT
jgi:hypothetical protein